MRKRRDSADWEVAGRVRRAVQTGAFGALEEIYGGLPETRCEECGRCCFESPGLFHVEYLALAVRLRALPRARREDVEKRALREVLLAWIEPERGCLFLEGRRCGIYAERPLTCRLFGLSAPSDPARVQSEMRQAAEQEADQLSWFGVEVPAATPQRAMAACDRVRGVRRRLREVDPDELAERVAALDARVLPEAVVRNEYCFRSLPDRLGIRWFGEALEVLRMQVMRRAQAGERVEDLVALVWEARGRIRARGRST